MVGIAMPDTQCSHCNGAYRWDGEVMGYVCQRCARISYVGLVPVAPPKSSVWTPEDDELLIELTGQGMSVLEISRILDRSETAISKRTRIKGVTYGRESSGTGEPTDTQGNEPDLHVHDVQG